MPIKAALFDLYGTLAHVKEPVSDRQACEFLVDRGYEVYSQAFKAARQFVSFIDYPKYGYRTWEAYLKRILELLGIKPDDLTLKELAKMYKNAKWVLYPDVEGALAKAKDFGLKTAIVTTIARFKYEKVIGPILNKVDLLVDGYTFNCEKSNPKIYLKTLETLGIKANEAVMVGDDIELDVLLPKRLGIHAIFLDRIGKLSPKNCKEADAIVIDLNEAMNVVANWV